MSESRSSASSTFRFSGFASPNFTQIPDQLFDELLPILSGNEMKTLLYICRRTFGFKKEGDNISLAQMVAGITTKDGVKLDGGTGLSKASVARALKSLAEKKVIVRVRRRDEQQGDLPTTYLPNMSTLQPGIIDRKVGSLKTDTPRVSHRDTPLSHAATPRVSHGDTQETAIQKTDVAADHYARVAAALINYGMSQRASVRLTKQHSPDYIAEKIEFLEFKLEQKKDSVKRPAAWLRRAIEDDYRPPNGFITAAERERREREENTRKKAAREAGTTHSALSKQRYDQRVVQKNQQMQQLFDHYKTSESDLTFWKKTQKHLADAGISQAVTSSMQLLRLRRDEALVHVSNTFMHQQIDNPRLKKPVEKVLSQLAGRPIHMTLVIDNS